MNDESKNTIIEFYNRIYLPQMKPYIFSLEPKKSS